MIMECIELNWVLVFHGPRPPTWSPALTLNLYYRPWPPICIYRPWPSICIYRSWPPICICWPWPPICIYRPWPPICIYRPLPQIFIYRSWPQIFIYQPWPVRSLSLHIPILSHKFLFNDPDLRFILPGSELAITFLLVVVAVVVNISSSCNFFRLDTTNISTPILVLPCKVWKPSWKKKFFSRISTKNIETPTFQNTFCWLLLLQGKNNREGELKCFLDTALIFNASFNRSKD